MDPVETQEAPWSPTSASPPQNSQSQRPLFQLASSLSVPSIASRKAALFQKLGGSNTVSNAATQSSTPSRAALSTPSFTKPDWMKALEEDQTNNIIPEKILPLATGSTIASTVIEGVGQTEYSDAIYELGSGDREQPKAVVSKVRLAVQALNALDRSKASHGTSWRVGLDDTDCTSSRSLSRMSELTKVGELEPSKSILPSDLPRRHSSCYPGFDISSSGKATEYMPRPVSPRTGLAYTILPLWARKQSFTGEELDLDPFPSRVLVESHEEASEIDITPMESAVDEPNEDSCRPINLPEHLGLCRSPTPEEAPPMSPTIDATRLSRASERVTSGSAVRRAVPLSRLGRRHSTQIQPTEYWKPPSRLNHVRTPSIVKHQDPLTIKPQNKLPLRKVVTNKPRPMRFA